MSADPIVRANDLAKEAREMRERVHDEAIQALSLMLTTLDVYPDGRKGDRELMLDAYEKVKSASQLYQALYTKSLKMREGKSEE